MRFLHITDTHVTAKGPSSRQDVYYVAVLRKFMELGAVIQRENVDAVIHTGDLFHTSRVALSISSQLVEIMKSWDVPIYIVPGNHDIDGYNISTISQTMLGMLSAAEVVELLTRENAIEHDINGKTLRIEGQEYYNDIDKGIYDDYRFEQPTDYNILAIHSMLMEKPYFPEVPHTLIQDVKTDANLVLTGHYHPGFTEQTVNGTTFFNPGSLLRPEIEQREPRYLIFDIDETVSGTLDMVHYHYGTLNSAMPASVTFDFAHHTQKKTAQQGLSNFKKAVQQAVGINHHLTIPQLLGKIAQANQIDPTIVQVAEQYINQSKADETQSNQDLKGFIEKPSGVYLKSARLIDFQSHEDTYVEFDSEMTVIIGETNAGKSSLLRGITWGLYNEPKGTDFIRTGKSSCKVILTFSDGSIIERSRSRSSAGKYVVTDPQGNTQVFSGFANDIPAEIANQHQMPQVQLTKDLKRSLNVASQLEGPFLLTESNIQKASAVGRIAGTQVVDNAIKELNKTTLATSRQIKQAEADIQANELKLKSFKDLDKLEQHIQLFEMTLDSYRAVEKELENIAILTKDYYCNGMFIQGLKEDQAKLPNLKGFNEDILVAQRLINELESLDLVASTLRNSMMYVQMATTALRSIPVVNPSDPLFNQAMMLVSEIEQLLQLQFGYRQIKEQIDNTKQRLSQLPVIDLGQLNVAEQLVQSLEETVKQKTEFTQITQQRLHVSQQLELIKQREVQAKQHISVIECELAELLKDHECPLCGTLMGEHQIKHIVRGE